MKITIHISTVLLILLSFTKFVYANDNETFSLIVKVDELRNSEGVVQFALYNRDDTIPDKEYENYYIKQVSRISKGSSSTVFNDLPKGKYAVNILHDENMNGEIDTGFIFPIEGIGFTNYQSVGLTNRPNFLKASFELTSDTEKLINIIYF